MVRKYSHFTGYPLRGPGPDYTLPASGASDDWAYATVGAAAMTWEIGDIFHESCDTFDRQILPTNVLALTYAAKLARHPFLLSKGPDIVHLKTNVVAEHFLTYNQSLTLSFLASDSVYSNPNYKFAAQAVALVWIYVDQHPYATQWYNETMPPHWILDRSGLDSSGNGQFTWNWSTLESHWRSNLVPVDGEHNFYLIAVDDDGYPGPLSVVSVMVAGDLRSHTPCPSGTPSFENSSNSGHGNGHGNGKTSLRNPGVSTAGISGPSRRPVGGDSSNANATLSDATGSKGEN